MIGTGEWTSKYLILFTTAIVSNSNVSGSRTQWRLNDCGEDLSFVYYEVQVSV